LIQIVKTSFAQLGKRLSQVSICEKRRIHTEYIFIGEVNVE